MTFSEENRRTAISWTVTLLTHVVLLLLPLSFHPIRSQGESVTGYLATMVELEQTTPVPPPQKEQLARRSTVATAPAKPAVTKRQQKPPEDKEPEAPVKERVSVTETHLKTSAQPEVVEEADGKSDNTGSTNAQSEGKSNQDGAPAEPTRANLGNGNGQIIKGTSPIYPKNAQNHKITGTVRCRVVIRADGRIGEVKILSNSGDSSLDNSVLYALTNNSMWKFQPADSAYFIVLDFIFTVTKVDINYIKAGWEDDDQ
jgi:TonB family protein